MSRRTLYMPEAQAEVNPAFFARERADRLLRDLLDPAERRQDSMKIFGRPALLPRLTAWHGGDEAEFGKEPVVASKIFGRFQSKHRRRKELKAAVELAHGSLLVMRGSTQANWLHQVPKTAQPVGERINLTFRKVAASR